MGMDLVDAIGKLLGIGDARNLGFHPDKVSVGRISTSALDTVVNSSTKLIVPLTNTAKLPVEMNLMMGRKGQTKQL